MSKIKYFFLPSIGKQAWASRIRKQKIKLDQRTARPSSPYAPYFPPLGAVLTTVRGCSESALLRPSHPPAKGEDASLPLLPPQ